MKASIAPPTMNHREDSPPTPKDLLKELHALVAEAEALVANSLVEHSDEALEGLRARLAAAQERVSALYAGAKKRVADGARSTDAAIRENPYQSLAIAAAAGLLLGVVLGRRSK
jgi:ElaB/YqjD/DUF883 family membrane-anchored ribosome-binding protein